MVASDAGAYAEMIIEGETGSVVPAGDYGRLRDAISTFLEPQKAILAGRRGREHVEAAFGLEREADQLADVYASLLGTTLPQASARPKPATSGTV